MRSKLTLLAPAALILLSATASAEENPPNIGDPANGELLYQAHCADCHGKDAKGGRTAVNLAHAGRMTIFRNDQLFELIKSGAGLKKPKEHSFEKKLSFLDTWDVIQHLRLGHLQLHEFFPNASRYVSKVYTIDEHGLGRIKKLAGKEPEDKSAAVFTFFTFEGEEGNLAYVPQDPIQLDQLKRQNKVGYLVFLDFASEGFKGEIGIAMDADGKITHVAAHSGAPKADLVNKSLSRFVGQGRKGLSEPFKIAGGKAFDQISKDLFPVYLRAMETVTMYDRDEHERTWADLD